MFNELCNEIRQATWAQRIGGAVVIVGACALAYGLAFVGCAFGGN